MTDARPTLIDCKGRIPVDLRNQYPPYSVIALQKSIGDCAENIIKCDQAEVTLEGFRKDALQILETTQDPVRKTKARLALEDYAAQSVEFKNEIARQKAKMVEAKSFLPRCKKRDVELQKRGFLPLGV